MQRALASAEMQEQLARGGSKAVFMTPPQFAVLTMIVSYPGLSGADLARLTFLTPQTINVIVGNLEKAGAIDKSAHASHGRILQLTATAKGQALLKRCRIRVMEVEDRIGGLVGREIELLERPPGVTDRAHVDEPDLDRRLCGRLRDSCGPPP